jgi:hypothetical protein
LFFFGSADSPSHQATVGVSAAPPVVSILDRITRSERLGTACARLFAGEGEVHLQRLLIRGGHQGALPETAETLRTLATVQVAFALFPTQNPTAAGHLESLGDPFSCFAFSGDSSHRAGTVSAKSGFATGIAADLRARPIRGPVPGNVVNREFPGFFLPSHQRFC